MRVSKTCSASGSSCLRAAQECAQLRVGIFKQCAENTDLVSRDINFQETKEKVIIGSMQ